MDMVIKKVLYYSGVILQNALPSFRIKAFYNLDKIHIVWWLFCDRHNIDREI